MSTLSRQFLEARQDAAGLCIECILIVSYLADDLTGDIGKVD